ncbi:MAG TPA: hypothetical protein VLB73_04155 [Patescibacteria group bacterium]|nr:hypothetical protein [Patescibacteria group bacterium]
MEIAYSDGGLRIKGKQVTLATQLGKSKTPTDAVILLGKNHATEFFSNDAGVVFQGAGEYEIKGTKVTGFKAGESAMYTIRLEGLSLFVGYVSGAVAMKDKLHEHDIAILLADDVLPESIMGILNARVVIFAGEKTAENAKAFEKEGATINKYAITKDKLPAETEFVFLG